MPEPLIFRPKPTDDILCNPHIGFNTYQGFNGDPLYVGSGWTTADAPEEFGLPTPVSLHNPDHPFSTVAYLRWYWDTIEPKDGQYRWDIIDGALATARERGQTLGIRVMCHDHESKHDVPGWFRNKGAKGAVTNVGRGENMTYWLPDYTDPLYIKYWTRITAELAARYDGHRDLEFVDCASIGPWGEWSTRPVDPPMWAKAALIDCYTDNFRKTPLLMQIDDAPSMRYGIEHGTGWRADSLGDMGWNPLWCHMRDAYPQGIVYGGATEAWKTRPVSLEAAGVMGDWYRKGWDIDYILDQAIKWHISTYNSKSSLVPEEWRPSVDRWLKRMGYRFVLRKFLATPQVCRGAIMRFHTWWENTGCAPIYRRYELALQFMSGATTVTAATDADITTWLPGDTIYDGAVFLPPDMPTGKYQLRIGMLDTWTGEARIAFANENRADDGWHDLGEIEVVPTDRPVARYVDPGAP
jgi:hypothetical protein